MSRNANPAMIGAFVVGAVAIALTTVLLVAGGQWFQERRQHMIYFEGAAQGLQIGAPVMFLGVRVGTVKRIQLGLDPESRRFMVPVTIEVESSVVKTSLGEQVDLRERETIRQLVEHGLRAQLRMQSLLTGQLYVDLDFHPDKPARFLAIDQSQSEIPAIPTTVEELSSKIEGFPVEAFLTDLAAITKSINSILAATAASDLPARLATSARRLESFAARLDTESEPIIAETKNNLALIRETLTAARAAAEKAGTAAEQAGEAARTAGEKTGDAADRLGGMADAGTKTFAGLKKAGDDLATAARALATLASADSPTVPAINATLQEIARAARAARLLAETLEQQPEAVLRGKKTEEGK